MWKWGSPTLRSGLLGVMLAGCSFVIELDGPGFVDIPEQPDGSTLTPLDTFVADATIDASIVDMQPADDASLSPELPAFELTLSAAAPVLIHTGTGQLRATSSTASSHTLHLADGDMLTVVFDDPPLLVSLLALEAGGQARIDRPAPAGRTTSMRVRLASPYPDASGYAITNGCRTLRCAGEGCAGWFEDVEMSLAVTDRCTRMGMVHTVVIALDADDQPIGWAKATDPFPESSQAVPTFDGWTDAISEIPLILEGLDDGRVFGVPWSDLAYDAALSARRTESGRTLRMPRGVSSTSMFGLDYQPPDTPPALGRAPHGIRQWRRSASLLPVVLRADRLPPRPIVVVRADPDGARPRVRWRSDAPPRDGTYAQIGLTWGDVAEDERVEWQLYTAAHTGSVRLPVLPEAWAHLRPPEGSPGAAVQVTLVDCQIETLRALYTEGCPLFAPSKAEPLHREVRWSAAHVIVPSMDPEAGAAP